MKALDLKLFRDLHHIWPQALAIALVLAAGIATLLIAVGAHQSLYDTREAYYGRYRFADIFATAKRAPRELVEQVRSIPGVAAAEARIAGIVLIDVEGLAQPATGQIVSLPRSGEPALNALYIREGRVPDPERGDEIVSSAAFADAHGFAPGDRIVALLNGRKRALTITGIAYSPEFIYAIGPGQLVPDDKRFGVFWMAEKAAGAAFDLTGAFNSLSVRILRGTKAEEVIDRLDVLLKRYGGQGAYARKDQTSHAFIDAELMQLEAMTRVMPPIFLAVAAFLINMTLARIIAMEREQIGLFKAIGYGPGAIAGHYFKFALAIAFAGLVIGVVAGTLLGRGLTRLYADFFHFPFLFFSRDPALYVMATLVAVVAGASGAAKSVWSAIRLPPAVAMAPPAPPMYRRRRISSYKWLPRVSQLSLMVIRHIVRWPAKAALTSLGIALAVGLLVGSLFAFDSMEHMVDVTFFQAERQDATLNFTETAPQSAIQAVEHLPGVLRAEPFRVAPVRISFGHRERRTVLVGKPVDGDLSRALDVNLAKIEPPDEGIALYRTLGEILHVRTGDRVSLEILEGRGLTVEVPVRDLVESYISTQAIMELTAVNRLLGEGSVISGAHIAYDKAAEEAIFAAVKQIPKVAAINSQDQALASFRETLAENVDIMTAMYLGFAALIAFGVIYNSSRVRLSERARELASLRVLGFSKSEVYWVLFAEFAILTLAAIPLGWALGYGMALAIVEGFKSELYRLPLVIGPDKYAVASLVVLASAAVSAFIVRDRVERLDLISVLKTRE